MSERHRRWTKATVYADMWVDPDDDPSNSDGVSPDSELATMADYLHDYRLTVRMKCEGLDAEQLARRSVPPSPSRRWLRSRTPTSPASRPPLTPRWPSIRTWASG